MGIVFALLIAAAAAGTVYACSAPGSRVFQPVIIRGPQGSRRVLLTFDDGPAPPYTDRILDILRERGIRAIFFLCGAHVERHPELAQRIVREGHTIGNHTYSHPLLYLRSPEFMKREIDRTQAIIEQATGVRPRLFRPPYGARWPGLMPVLKKIGLQMMMWSATGYDWKYSADRIVRAVAREIRPGAVILLHDGHARRPQEEIDRSNTVAALPRIIDEVRRAGLEFGETEEFISM